MNKYSEYLFIIKVRGDIMSDLENSVIVYRDYGTIKFDIKSLMDKKDISVTQMAKRTGLHTQVIKRYYEGNAERYDKEVLSKFCFILDCNLDDIMFYEKPKN